MGADFYEEYPAFREIFDLLSERQRKIAFEGPEEELADTVNTQPVMVAFAAGVDRLLADAGIRPELAAGLSLRRSRTEIRPAAGAAARGSFDKRK